MRAALIQLCTGDDPSANLPDTATLIAEAAGAGASLILTPECTNIISADRDRQRALLQTEADDQTLAALRLQAAEAGVWLLIGSLLLRADQPGDARFVNRSLLVAPDGNIAARYDKIHMFDAEVAVGEHYRESAAVRPGARAVLAPQPLPLGMTICYDLRFPQLFRRLAQAGAAVLTVPAAFTVPTGTAHWHVLLRARAIETGCFVLAPAQCGSHPVSAPAAGLPADRPPRRSFGHSLAVAPWGEVLADGGEAPGVTLVEIDPAAVAEARRRVGSVRRDQPFEGPAGA